MDEPHRDMLIRCLEAKLFGSAILLIHADQVLVAKNRPARHLHPKPFGIAKRQHETGAEEISAERPTSTAIMTMMTIMTGNAL